MNEKTTVICPNCGKLEQYCFCEDHPRPIEPPKFLPAPEPQPSLPAVLAAANTALDRQPDEDIKREPDYAALTQLMTTKRPHKSKSEKRIIRELITPLDMKRDDCGNLYKRIGDVPVLWSCHTDSVHHRDGMQGVKIEGGKIMLANGSTSNCLGADDAAGIWLMREMILANKPGLYVFHRGEEVGGIGSRYISDKTPELLDGIKWAIAFDRRGTTSVITHQGWSRTCSDVFGEALAKKLGMGYRLDDGGLFTDTANYKRQIPECTNLSVGYTGEHSRQENLDIVHLLALRKKLLSLDASDLPCVRDPNKFEYKQSKWADDDYGYGEGEWWKKKKKKKKNKGKGVVYHNPWKPPSEPKKIIYPHEYGLDQGVKPDNPALSLPNLYATVAKNPTQVIKILKDYGLTTQDILDEIYGNGGVLYYYDKRGG